MALNEKQQIFEYINKSKHILITGKEEFDGDGVASGLGLYFFLEKINKRADLIFLETNIPENFNFLPGKEVLKNKLGELQKLIIKIEAKDAQPSELSYDKTDEGLYIYLTPKSGLLKPEHIKTESSDYKYDLIIVLGSPDLESLGKIYSQHADFFFNTPIINIDHQPNNEHFGQINIVNLNASSVSEIIFDTIHHFGEGLVDSKIATCLYTGMTVKTKSFKHINLTPNTLNIASQLITQGADRQNIIHHLYRTKSVNTLKLWGRALARLQYDDQVKIGWSQLTEKDFTLTQTKENDLKNIIDELLSETPEADIIIIFYEWEKISKAIVYTTPNYDALKLTKKYESQGNKQLAKIEFPNKNILELEREVIQEIQRQIS